ncbi:unnamed protein product [Echinostoma caproni]|uniref:BLUF domain-containing protein n=1 Tax=Echinostoma caproni TaxID=27848 RepID=A0A183B380_9TREM|nr:unnamed protein product [Echinostoma caproni]
MAVEIYRSPSSSHQEDEELLQALRGAARSGHRLLILAIHINGQLLTTDKDIADSFLVSFQKVFCLDSLSNYSTFDRVSDMPDLVTSTPDVKIVLKTLKISKSAVSGNNNNNNKNGIFHEAREAC